MSEKWCVGCKVTHPVEAFGRDRSRTDGLNPTCRTFKNRRAVSAYTPHPAERHGPAPLPARDGDVRQARARVNHYVDTGRLPDPNTLPCADCGHVYVEGGKRHEYDHHLGYGAEHHLDVEAVCSTCHHARERRRVA